MTESFDEESGVKDLTFNARWTVLARAVSQVA
jgi:hypothetical protein